jgi:hypothetical protein
MVEKDEVAAAGQPPRASDLHHAAACVHESIVVLCGPSPVKKQVVGRRRSAPSPQRGHAGENDLLRSHDDTELPQAIEQTVEQAVEIQAVR